MMTRLLHCRASQSSTLLSRLVPQHAACSLVPSLAKLPHRCTWQSASTQAPHAQTSPATLPRPQAAAVGLSSQRSIAGCWRDSLCTCRREPRPPRGFVSIAASADPAAVDENLQGSRLVLVDAMSFIYRAHHGYGAARLTSASGVDTTIIFSFVNAVLALMELNPPPTHIAVVFDAPGKTFSSDEDSERARGFNLGPERSRNEIYPGYKGQRPKQPDEISISVPQIQAFLHLMGVPQLMVNGVEADDVIGTMATRAVRAGMLVVIASPDKDFYQLLQPGLQMLRPAKRGPMGAPAAGTVAGNLAPYTADSFTAEFGVQPNQWADVLALAGDSSDNIPGVTGIGQAGALKLVQQFGDVESILALADDVKRKQAREALQSEAGQAEARLAKRLVTVQTDMDLPPLRKPLRELALQPPFQEQVDKLVAGFAELDMNVPTQRMMAIWARMKEV